MDVLRRRFLAVLLAFMVFSGVVINSYENAYASSIVIGGGAAVSVGEAIAFLLGAFGLTAASVAVYDNVDSVKSWGNEQIKKFEGYCSSTAEYGQAVADDVGEWIYDFSQGSLDTTSTVWTAFRSWCTRLTTETYSAPGFPDYACLATDSAVSDYFGCTITDAKSPVYLIRVLNGYNYKNEPIIRYNFISYDFFKVLEIDNRFNSRGYLDVGPSFTRLDGEVINFYYATCLDNADDTSFDGIFLHGLYDTGEEHYGQPNRYAMATALLAFSGAIVDTDYTVVDVGLDDVWERDEDYTNVGWFPPIPRPDGRIPIDWALVGGIPGLLHGLTKGTTSIVGVLDGAGIIVGDDVTDKVIDDTGITDTPIADVIVDTSAFEDYTMPGLESLFPFCLPFDLIDFIGVLNAEPQAPHFQWPIKYPTGNGWAEYVIDIDLSKFDTVALLLRDMECLSFIVGLILLTRDKMIRG